MSSHVSLPRRAFAAFWTVLPGLALFEICYKALAAFAVKPLLRLLADKTLGRGGVELAFNERILGALASPWGLVGGLALAVLAVLGAYYEFSVLFLSACCAARGTAVSLRTAMELAVPTLRSLKSWGVLGFAVYALGLLPLLDLGFSPALLPAVRIPRFITGELSKTPFGQAAVVLFYAAAFAVFVLLLFTVPAMALGRQPFGRAARRSGALLKEAGPRGWAACGAFFLVWGVLFRWPGLLPTRFAGITGAGFSELVTNLLAGRLLGSVPAFLVTELLRLGLALFFVALLTQLYLLAGGEAALDTAALPAISARVDRAQQAARTLGGKVWDQLRALWDAFRRRPLYRKHKKLLAAAALMLLFWLGGVFAAPPALHAPIAIGHRGSSQGVENTLESVQGAIDAGADYAEIDILPSADGVPVVIPDANLARLAGDGRNVYELTAAELGRLTLRQNGFTGHISTLADMLDYCQGKIDLLVELKTHGHETQDIARRVVEEVEAHHATDRCIFMSIDYDLVQALHALRPRYVIGYCVYGSVTAVDAGALIENGVDFLTIEENMVSPRFVNRCLRAGLPLYVWTVDDQANMAHYLDTGVSGIVSDDPAAAREITQGYDGDPAKDFFRWQQEWMD